VSGSALSARFTRPYARLRRPAPGRPGWLPKWSEAAALRAVRATVVIPGLFALSDKVIGNPQMTLFVTFGGFSTLVLASFSGTRRDKAIAHLGLALAGSALLVIGTLISSRAWLAAIVTVPVAFVTFFAGVAGANAGSGVLAALLTYVLATASPATIEAIPSRLAGWWLASAAGTAAVLLLSPKPTGDRLRAAAAGLAASLAGLVEDALRGELKPGDREASAAAKNKLLTAFSTAPYGPTGLATGDQALANVVELLEWSAGLVSDALDNCGDLARAAPAGRELLARSSAMLRDVAALLNGADAQPDFDGLERYRAAEVAYLHDLAAAEGQAGHVVSRAAVALSFYARAVALAARNTAVDSLVVARRADQQTIAAQRRRWYGGREDGAPAEGRLAGLTGAFGVAARHASIRSVWFLNSLRGSLALAAAVAVADVSGLQHAFWIVLGTLSVLRTNASATGATAARALAGTVIGFAVGAALLLAVGTNPVALWAVLPVAVVIAAYAPGTAPFAVGQAAFTFFVVVLFNLLAPAGWKVGLLRIEDVAIGCAVSLVVGIVFWPRGAGRVVANDLADAFRCGSDYLRQAVDWALGVRRDPPDAGVAAVTAGLRLDDGLRGYLTELGAKRLKKEELWSLVLATLRLRLAANSLAGLPAMDPEPAHPRDLLGRATRELTGFYERVADLLERPVGANGARGDGSGGGRVDELVEVPSLTVLDVAPKPPPSGSAARRQARALWVNQHLRSLDQNAHVIPGPAAHVAEVRRIPWWRP
jgi:uncharacterized membrane protein YccC